MKTNKGMGQRLMAAVAGLAIMASMVMGQAIEQKITLHIDGKFGTESVKKGAWTLVVPDADQGVAELRSGKRVIKAAFTRQALSEVAAEDKVTWRMEADGSRGVATIQLKGQKVVLTIGENPIARR